MGHSPFVGLGADFCGPINCETLQKWASKRVLCKVKCCLLAIPDQDCFFMCFRIPGSAIFGDKGGVFGQKFLVPSALTDGGAPLR